MSNIIGVNRSIIPACDVNLEKFEQIIIETQDIPQVGAYKLGAALALTVGLPKLVEIARKYTKKPLIYDHQKGGTDIPETGKVFTETLKACGIDAFIIFPFTGPATQTAWILSARTVGLPLIVGGHMTHEKFLSRDGGYIDEQATEKIYTNAASHGIADYVVPGNKPEVIRKLRSLLEKNKIEPVFYAPGFIAQGGEISQAAEAAGPRWHAIVGRAIYEAVDIQKAALSLIKSL